MSPQRCTYHPGGPPASRSASLPPSAPDVQPVPTDPARAPDPVPMLRRSQVSLATVFTVCFGVAISAGLVLFLLETKLALVLTPKAAPSGTPTATAPTGTGSGTGTGTKTKPPCKSAFSVNCKK